MEKPLLFDGAMGTYIASKELFVAYPEEANVAYPEAVLAIHREYIAAGALAIKTNTFGLNRNLVSDDAKMERLLFTGYDLALEAAGGAARVFADIGPIFGEEAEAEYVRVAGLFLRRGANRFLFETQAEMRPLEPALRYIRESVADAEIIVSFAVGQDGYAKSGLHCGALIERAFLCGADISGLNCVCGPAHMLELIRELPFPKHRLIAMPNAGYPSVANGRTVYVDNPGYFAEKLAALGKMGVETLGGCCGTTPSHIRLLSKLLAKKQPIRLYAEPIKPDASRPAAVLPPSKPFIALELPAPLDADPRYLLSSAEKAKASGADFVTIPDSPLGKARANSFMTASLIKRRVGIDAMPHLTCRDRNPVALKGELISGCVDGLSKVLIVTGDALAETERGGAANASGMNSFRLIEFVRSLNERLFTASPYEINAALNIGARNFDAELRRAEKKIELGATRLFSQPAYTDEALSNLRLAQKSLPVPVAAGVLPVAGLKNALFLKNEVPGVEIPDELIERLRDTNATEAKEICLQRARESIDALGECDGYYLMTPLKKIEYTAALARYIREIRV